ncbi:carbohydrate-binding module family 1 protein [Serpula lacrymans var. lacrymans S7.9]|uniref:Carbohydrate-binding module family 1 protein n=1 Tax=Serpula lacrymans var. lacrymans (strain S7.9) TaxID=578457 RepID=F8P6H8_SERL9|nr:carbohydrate-binding module family 1 protein [Serpula lacrymans var. lacrymans S7.9]EGO21045.1 carbohydrate-binding module family 1 protein [Serpula lacrymans var. lacrymans S7.9]
MFSHLLTTIILSIGFRAVTVVAQSATAYCDSTSGICYAGYTDPTLNITVGLVLPPLSTGTTPNATEFVAELIAPASYGWTGLSVGGTMADSLLFTMWPYNGEVIFGPRWTSGYVQPLPYSGPIITMLPDTMVNSTHIKASFRCQNCTTWNGGALGSGDLSGFQLIAYVASDDTPVDDPSNVASNFTEHDQMNFFGLDLSISHSTNYSTYIGTTGTSPSEPTQTEYGQCGGTGWTGPTVCVTGTDCTEVSPPYYSQCL